MNPLTPMTLDAFKSARSVLQGVLRSTHLIPSPYLSKLCGNNVYLKPENMQVTGAYKIRGAYYKISTLSEEEKSRGLITASAGNHAQGVAFAASRVGVPATIVMPRSTPIAKVSATKGYGAKVVLHGAIYDEAYAKACEIVAEEGAELIHPFDDEDVIAGQGTIALEILSDLPFVDMVLVPAGGGGLVSGVAACIKQINPRIQVIGVQAAGAPAIVNSFGKEAIQPSASVHTIADGIAVKNPGETTMRYINQYVDQMVTVTDAEIAEAILLLLERTKQVVEPAGATPLAAVLHNKVDIRGKKICCVLSGGNIDVSFIHKVVEKGLITRCRQLKISTVMPDIPGALERFAHLVAAENANIILVQHDRIKADLDIGDAILHVVCEVSGKEHGQRLLDTLRREGYQILD